MKLILHNRKSKEKYQYELQYVINNETHSVFFGLRGVVNYIDINDRRKKLYMESKEQREAIKNDFREKIDKSILNKYNHPVTLEYYILYNKPTLRESIKNYERNFGVYLKRVI
jgi:hypothetical protein